MDIPISAKMLSKNVHPRELTTRNMGCMMEAYWDLMAHWHIDIWYWLNQGNVQQIYDNVHDKMMADQDSKNNLESGVTLWQKQYSCQTCIKNPSQLSSPVTPIRATSSTSIARWHPQTINSPGASIHLGLA